MRRSPLRRDPKAGTDADCHSRGVVLLPQRRYADRGPVSQRSVGLSPSRRGRSASKPTHQRRPQRGGPADDSAKIHTIEATETSIVGDRRMLSRSAAKATIARTAIATGWLSRHPEAARLPDIPAAPATEDRSTRTRGFGGFILRKPDEDPLKSLSFPKDLLKSS